MLTSQLLEAFDLILILNAIIYERKKRDIHFCLDIIVSLEDIYFFSNSTYLFFISSVTLSSLSCIVK